MKKSEVKSLAIGRFDGLHLGHFAILRALDENGAALVIKTGNSVLTPNREEFLEIPCFYYDLSAIRTMSASEFVALLKRDFPNLRKIAVGFDFRFAHNRSAGISELKSLFDGEIYAVDEFKIDGVGVHSKKIKEFLSTGNLALAAKFLGRNYSVKGVQIRGQGLGSKELFATLNLDTSPYFLPKNGVYATIFRDGKNSYKSVTFIGIRETTDTKFSVETHILDDFKTCAGEIFTLEFIKFIRENRKFENLTALKNQISNDIKSAKKALL